ncbi:Penicillin-binding protein E [Candidatus Ornithobacterium hominis]|uniref:Penicillin-binding protein E n=1 Tax=Candidatus Ornithobacterium hominis TaxID=2497989 RepID=A0A383U449_9FLAO|nr:serine hydrolase domain-containing protein [Candidatus Ornithobacterium hominis]MCT7905175.1 beta-lactamase family protein [Candidatus Ornithobacterium hominis]SZD74248.1 Penicillin-binding protein E [Candidatus Ornithobacterium hominis]
MMLSSFSLKIAFIYFIFSSIVWAEIPVKNYSKKALAYHDTVQGVYAKLRQELSEINIGAQKPSFNGSVLVAHKGKLIFADSYGVSNRSIGLKNTLDTPTQIASITKTFTGTSILWLAERGFLDIKDPVQKYLWEFPYANITIENLLSHRSGLQDYIKYSFSYWNSNDPMYNSELLSLLSKKKFRLLFTPGAKFDYCNTNYAVLGLLIERISGTSYKNFLTRYIFNPIGMENSFVYDPAEEFQGLYARSYKSNFSDFPNTHQDGVYADKGIFTTVNDLFKWDRALHNHEFLKEESLEEAFTPRSSWSVKKNYGLGWRIKCYPNGEKYVYHTGWWHGYQGIFSRYIKDDFTIIILSNRYISGISDNAEEMYNLAQKHLNLTPMG